MDQWNDNTIFLKEILKNDKFDVVIDDGCHDNKNALITFESILPNLNKKFIYFIEDHHNPIAIFKKKWPHFNIYSKEKMMVITN